MPCDGGEGPQVAVERDHRLDVRRSGGVGGAADRRRPPPDQVVDLCLLGVPTTPDLGPAEEQEDGEPDEGDQQDQQQPGHGRGRLAIVGDDPQQRDPQREVEGQEPGCHENREGLESLRQGTERGPSSSVGRPASGAATRGPPRGRGRRGPAGGRPGRSGPAARTTTQTRAASPPCEPERMPQHRPDASVDRQLVAGRGARRRRPSAARSRLVTRPRARTRPARSRQRRGGPRPPTDRSRAAVQEPVEGRLVLEVTGEHGPQLLGRQCARP